MHKKISIGIDLGSTYSLVASTYKNETNVLSNSNGFNIFPSAIHYDINKKLNIGYDALLNKAYDPINTLTSFKRLIGCNINEIDKYESIYKMKIINNVFKIYTRSGWITPIEISSGILNYLLNIAKYNLKKKIYGSVITVPAYFNELQRQATRKAAESVGINVIRMINEPTAAAIAYGLNNYKEGLYVVYDLGGGTFDVSILNLKNGVFEIIATGGNNYLGGDDFDNIIMKHICKKNKIKESLLTIMEKKILLTEIRNIKENLTYTKKIKINFKLNKTGKYFIKNFLFNNNKINNLIKPLVKNTINYTKKILYDSNISKKKIKEIVLVGGSTRMPIIKNYIQNYFKKKPLCSFDPDEVVVIGAALHANMISSESNKKKWLLLDIIPISLGIETIGGIFEKIIYKNSTIPIEKSQNFTTFKNNQTSIKIHMLQGENKLISKCKSLGYFEFHNIPPKKAGKVIISVKFQVDVNCLLKVTAVEKSTGLKNQIKIKTSYFNSNIEIEDLKDKKMSRYFQNINELKNCYTKLTKLLNSAENILKKEYKILDINNYKIIKLLLNKCYISKNSKNLDLFLKSINILSKQTKFFIMKRINNIVKYKIYNNNI